MAAPRRVDRVCAAGIDLGLVLLATAASMVSLIVAGVVDRPDQAAAATAFATTTVLLATTLMVVYSTAMITRSGGQTVGKRMRGIRVVMRDGSPVGLGSALVRELGVKQLLFGFATVATFGAVQVANLSWPFIDEKRRTLHDMLAGTLVIDAAPLVHWLGTARRTGGAVRACK